MGARLVAVTGMLQNEKGVIHIVAEHFEDLTPLLSILSRAGGDISGLARADEVKRPQVREKASAAPLRPRVRPARKAAGARRSRRRGAARAAARAQFPLGRRRA